MTSSDQFEVRYAEDGDQYTVWVYTYGGTQVSGGLTMTRPKWLEDILTVAVVGGHLREVDAPPPSRLFWCYVDHDMKLLGFHDETFND